MEATVPVRGPKSAGTAETKMDACLSLSHDEADHAQVATLMNGKKRSQADNNNNHDDDHDETERIQNSKRPKNEAENDNDAMNDAESQEQQQQQQQQRGANGYTNNDESEFNSTVATSSDQTSKEVPSPSSPALNHRREDGGNIQIVKKEDQNSIKEEAGVQEMSPSSNGTSGTNSKHPIQVPVRRWRAHQMADDYIEFVGNIMYPGILMGPYGYNAPHDRQYPLERLTSLGYLTSPLRRPTVIEKWSPYEIASFEASLFQYGKVFDKVQKVVPTKTTKEIVEFYYVWKKTCHYNHWKEQYTSETGDSSDDEESDDIIGNTNATTRDGRQARK